MRILSPAILSRLNTLRLDLRRHRSEGHLSGRHSGRLRGIAQEFAEHRPYVPGDEPKHLDWKIFARKDRHFIKTFQEEKSLKTYILLDSSASMGYKGGGAESKWDRARLLAMAAAYLVLTQGDSAGLATFDTERRVYLPPRQSRTHLELMDELLSKTEPGGETALDLALSPLAASLPRRSLIILISDLLGDGARILAALRSYAAKKHRIMVMQVLDPMERRFDFDGPVVFEGLEGGPPVACEAGLIAAAYQEAFTRQQALYEASFADSGIFYGVFGTDESWDTGFVRFLSKQGLGG